MTTSSKPMAEISAADLSALIRNVKTSGTKYDALVQRAAAQCVLQSVVHRNVTPMNDLFESLPKGSRRDSLVAYFEKFGNAAWMKTEKKIAFFDADVDWTHEYSKTVAATMWTTGTKQAVIKSAYDLEDEFAKVLDRFEKLANDPSKNVGHPELLARMKAAYNAYVVDSFHNITSDNDEVEEEEIAA